MKKATWHGLPWAARRGPPSLPRQNDVFLTSSSGPASPSVLHILPRITTFVHFCLARTLGVV